MRRARRLFGVVFGLCAAFTAVLAGPAFGAAPVWQAPQTIAQSRLATGLPGPFPGLSVGGAAAVAWADARRPVAFRMSDVAPGSASPSLLVARSAPSLVPRGMALDGAGNAYAVWTKEATGGLELRVALRPFGGRFGKSVVLDTRLPAGVEPTLAVNDAGDAVVAWPAGRRMTAAVRRAGGAWTRASARGIGEKGSCPVAGMTSSGEAYVAWRSSTTAVPIAHRDPLTGTWSREQPLGSQNLQCPDLAVGGDVVAVAAALEEGGVLVTAKRLDTCFCGSEGLTSQPTGNHDVSVDVNAAGDAVVSWLHDVSGETEVWAARVLVDSNGYHALPDPMAITAPRLIDHSDVAVDGLGNRMVVFEQEFDDHSTHWIVAIDAPDRGPFDSAHERPVSSTFGTIAPPAFDPTIVADANGRFLATWHNDTGPFDTVGFAFALPAG